MNGFKKIGPLSGADFFVSCSKAFQPFPLKQDHIKDPDGDGGVGNIENGSEENEMSVLAEKEIGQPAVAVAGHVDDREIKHIDDFPMEPAGVVEDFTIKHTVQNIAQRSRCDQGKPEKHPELGSFFRESEKQENQDNHCHDPKDAEGCLDGATTAHPTESHSGVFDEKQLEPVTQYRNLLPNGHMRLYPDL